jgi:hypothetical protein
MRYSAHCHPIRYRKANAAKVLLDLAATREPMVITRNGEAGCMTPARDVVARLKAGTGSR